MQQSPTVNTQAPQLCAVTLLGNLVSTPDIRYRANPACAVTEITLATHSKWLDKNTKQYKEWTSYHHIKVEGELVEQALLQAQKGDIILVHGHLSKLKANKSEHHDIVHANFIQRFAKGYTQSINQIHCSATLTSQPKLMLTEHGKQLCQADIVIHQHNYSHEKQSWQNSMIERSVSVWGKLAEYLAEHGQINQELMVEGKLSYASNKSQYIEASKLHLF